MKRLVLFTLALMLAAGPAAAVTIGGGAFGGMSIPVVQDDNGEGAVYGIRAPVGISPMFTVEPFFAMTTGGEAEEDVGNLSLTRSGIDLTSFGANVLLTFGTEFKFFPYAGISSTASERDGLDQTSVAYNFGLGLGFSPFQIPLALDVRGEYQSVPDEDQSDAARNWANVTVGATYTLFTK